MKSVAVGIFISTMLCFNGSLLAQDLRLPPSNKAALKSAFVFVPGGCFKMGDDAERGAHPAHPVHDVCLNGFYMGKYEVTVGEFKTFTRETGYKTEAEKTGGCLFWMRKGWRKAPGVVWKRPGFVQTDDHPVTCVTWHDASAYIQWKQKKAGLDFRLPTEAEWEYAARGGGKRMMLYDEDDTAHLDQHAWFHANSDGQTHAVGLKKPNGLGLYDMSGNVWEWVQDRYSTSYYAESEKNNPQGPETGTGRVIRGGSWYGAPRDIRAAHRNWTYASKRYNSLGFRLVLENP
ncbi:MAG: formylglycine-generating enzyme family protein [Nitrospiria bacterium]